MKEFEGNIQINPENNTQETSMRGYEREISQQIKGLCNLLTDNNEKTYTDNFALSIKKIESEKSEEYLIHKLRSSNSSNNTPDQLLTTFHLTEDNEIYINNKSRIPNSQELNTALQERPDLLNLSKDNGMVRIDITDIIDYKHIEDLISQRLQYELVKKVASESEKDGEKNISLNFHNNANKNDKTVYYFTETCKKHPGPMNNASLSMGSETYKSLGGIFNELKSNNLLTHPKNIEEYKYYLKTVPDPIPLRNNMELFSSQGQVYMQHRLKKYSGKLI